MGVKFYNKSSEVVKLTESINRVIKSLISSFRTRGRRRMVEVLANHFGLNVSPTQSKEDVKHIAAGLLPIQFHQDPKAKSEKAGHYRSDFVARAIATLFYFGPRPPALRRNAKVVPMPVETVAFSCAVAEEIIMRYKKDGCIKVEQKAPKGQGQGRNRKKGAMPEKEIVPRTGLDELKDLMDVHLQNIEPFQKTVPNLYKMWLLGLHDQCLVWAGKSSHDSGDSKPVEGVLTADSYADEEDISPAELHAALSNSQARLRSLEPKEQPRPRARIQSHVSKLSNLDHIPEDPHSNSESEFGSRSGSESRSGLSSGNKPEDPSEIDELDGDLSERDDNTSERPDQMGGDTPSRKDVNMEEDTEEEDTEKPVRKLSTRPARRKVLASDSEEEAGEGYGAEMGEHGPDAGTAVSRDGESLTAVGPRVYGAWRRASLFPAFSRTNAQAGRLCL
ncbi:hypothetical protein RhiLY_11533 [Ceratobasidium sp. AG-Ba]|nr:hypothetical protein RhiLY_11533 [Ceratobasidium sp. AG-Ba]